MLDDVNELRKQALIIGKTAAMNSKLKDKRTEILELQDNGYLEMEALFKEVLSYVF